MKDILSTGFRKKWFWQNRRNCIRWKYRRPKLSALAACPFSAYSGIFFIGKPGAQEGFEPRAFYFFKALRAELFSTMNFVFHSSFDLCGQRRIFAGIAQNDQSGKVPAVRDFQERFDLFGLFQLGV